MKIISTASQNYQAVAVSSRIFSYDKVTKTFSADVSQLRGINPLGQLYKDACDQGFLIRNDKTDKAVPFVFTAEDRHHDEVVGFRFEVCPYAVRADRSLGGLKVLLVNT